MFDVLLSPSNFWFSIALSAVIFVCLLEVVSIMFGVSLLGLSDDAGDINSDGLMGSEFASWLNINKVPFLIWFIVFLSWFCALGFLLNGITGTLLNISLPVFVSVAFASASALFTTSKTATVIAAVLPSIQTSAQNNDDFVGAVATVTIGNASKSNPAEAKFTDSFSQPHYVLVEPIEDNALFKQGESVILVKKGQHSWLATRYQ
ncbi:OB-fold-containig protein [Alteromonas sp. A079]|uniref:OB-fold-containig protein n=1 Tax=Alteromonas sp. A079 TaxID=3410268 RepID=UPI003B9E0D5F